MNKSRRIGTIVAMATAAMGMAAVTATVPAAAAPRGPEPVSNWLRAVKAHSDTWVKVYWRTNQRICDASVRYYGNDVDVEYWGNRRSAVFSRGTSLVPGRIDYTTISVNPDFDRSGVARLRAVLSYDSCGWKARTQVRQFSISLPVERSNGWPGHGQPGRPGQGQPGGPGRPDQPGGPGRPDQPGGPGRPDQPGGPGRPNQPGQPGQPGRPDQPGRPNQPGQPGRPDWPGRPTGSPATTTAPATTPPATTAPATTAPATTAPATTAPATTSPAASTSPTTSPSPSWTRPPRGDGNGNGGDGNGGNGGGPRGNH